MLAQQRRMDELRGEPQNSHQLPTVPLRIQRVIENGENSIIITVLLISTCSTEQENDYISFALFFLSQINYGSLIWLQG